MSHAALKALQEIPGVGPSIAEDLASLGINKVSDLEHKDPESLYEQLMAHQAQYIDRCMLYVFRCAVYYAEGGRQPAKLLWWNWKDEKPPHELENPDTDESGQR